MINITKKTNILILPSWYPTQQDIMSGSFFKEQAIALRKYFSEYSKNFHIYIIFIENFYISNLKNIFTSPSFSVLNEDGIPTIRAKYLHIPKFHYLDCVRGAKHLAHVIKKAEKCWKVHFDLVHIHSAFNSGIWYSLSGLEMPYVITEHLTSYSQGLISPLEKKLLPRVFSQASEIIAVGNGLKKEIQKFTDKPIKVVYNIVQDDYIDGLDENQKSKNNIFTIFSLGMNAKKKGFDILLLAFKNFINSGNMGKLIIAGLEEKEKEWLLSLDLDSELYSHIELLGKLSREEVFKFMARCDCFALVSRYETFGVVFAEAMYCGKPVIATRTGGPDSFVNSENGILVSVNNVEETTEAIRYVKENLHKFNPDRIKRFAKQNFSQRVICKKICDIYNEKLGNSDKKE